MWINVTELDILNSKTNSLCPITLALQRYFKSDISVSRNFIRLRQKRVNSWRLLELPKPAQKFLFSSAQEPFKFWLSPKIVKEIKK